MTTPSDTARKVGKRLKEIRLSLHMTQVQVAEKAKINVNSYAKIERGEQKTSVEKYERIAKALKVSSSDIFPF